MMAWNLLEDRARRQGGERRASTVDRRDAARRARGPSAVLGRSPALASLVVLAGVALPSSSVASRDAGGAVLVGRCVVARRGGLALRSRPGAQDPDAPALAPARSRARRSSSPCCTLLAVLIGGVAELVPTHLRQAGGAARSATTQQPYTAARARGPRRLRPRGLLHLPLADDPPAAGARRSATATSRRAEEFVLRPPVPVGLASAPARTSRARAASTRTSGTTRT